jgi:hypothetical protein
MQQLFHTLVEEVRILKFYTLQGRKVLLDVCRLQKYRHYFGIVLLPLVYIIETGQITIILAQLVTIDCNSVVN